MTIYEVYDEEGEFVDLYFDEDEAQSHADEIGGHVEEA